MGMVVMTSGLKSLAGNAIRQALGRFTRSPASGAITGAVSTAVIQSSSATTVAAVGFVGAGLITFPQSLGILFGANIGTTITGWLVAILGFKLNVGELALPFILLGVLIHLFTRGRASQLGYALAGFGLVFVGIGLMQTGMAGLQGFVSPEDFPPNTILGRLLLVLLGIAITLVTQSSSAGIATAITAVHAGTISFPQAAALVIGMDVGTTATAALATMGGSTAVRRTGFAHVIYNVMTGIAAFWLVVPYTTACEAWAPEWFQRNPEIALVLFHTLFNTLGVLAVLPVTDGFARLMCWLVPEQPVRFTQRLDRTLLASPRVALDAVHGTLVELAGVVLNRLSGLLERPASFAEQEELSEANEGLKRTRLFLNGIQPTAESPGDFPRQLSVIHAIDHLRRLIDRCEKSKRVQRVREVAELREMKSELAAQLEAARSTLALLAEPGIPASPGPDPDAVQEAAWEHLQLVETAQRRLLIENAVRQRGETGETIHRLDAARWICRVSYHVYRIEFYLRQFNAPEESLLVEHPGSDADSKNPPHDEMP